MTNFRSESQSDVRDSDSVLVETLCEWWKLSSHRFWILAPGRPAVLSPEVQDTLIQCEIYNARIVAPDGRGAGVSRYWISHASAHIMQIEGEMFTDIGAGAVRGACLNPHGPISEKCVASGGLVLLNSLNTPSTQFLKFYSNRSSFLLSMSAWSVGNDTILKSVKLHFWKV